MVEQDLTPEPEEAKYFNVAFHKGTEAIKEMGSNFKPYLKIMVNDGIINPQEQIIVFGTFLLQTKIEKDGYKHITKNKFLNFYQEFKNKLK